MIQYPHLKKGQTIGVTAPSSGVQPSLHEMFQLSCDRMKKRGYEVICGDSMAAGKSEISPCNQTSK